MKNLTTKLLASTVILVGTAPFVETASAECTTTSSTSTTCTSASPNPSTSTIGTGASTASGYSVTVENGGQINAGATQNAISLGDNATINLQSGASVTNSPTNNSANVGLYKSGFDTIEFHNNGVDLLGLQKCQRGRKRIEHMRRGVRGQQRIAETASA